MMSKISIKSWLWSQIFGKIMVCKDMDTAGRVTREARHLNCVTIKGDQYSKKGTMTGGFIDVTRYITMFPKAAVSSA